MEFSGLEAQVFIGVAVILGCAFVALLCDYLKGVNERLRERTLELTVRVEESARWSHLLQAQAPLAATPSEAVPAEPGPGLMHEIARLHREMEQMARSVASLAELKLATTPVAAAHPVEAAYPVETAGVPAHVAEAEIEIERELVGAMAAVQPLAQVSQLVSQVAVPLPPLQAALAADPFTSQAPVSDRRIASFKPTESPVPALGPVVSFVAGLKLPPRDASRDIPAGNLVDRFMEAPTPEREFTQLDPGSDDVTVDTAPFEPARPGAMKIRVMRSEMPVLPAGAQPLTEQVPALTVAAEAVEPVAVPVPALATVPAAAPALVPEPEALPAHPGALELSLPSGMHDRATLDFLREDLAPFTGLVVAIGINDYERLEASAGVEAAQDLVRSVAQLVKSLTSNLMGPQHFACKSAADEFIIAYNGEIGPAAQRRMSSVSERLWDFQLRSIGTFSVVFSWGATEANEESFGEAIEAACERMRETRQNRKAMGGDRPRKRVVA